MFGQVSTLVERLAQRPLRGTFVKLPALEVIEIVASSLDFAVVDLEHSQLSDADALRLVRHAHVLGFPAVVRIPEVDRGLVNRLLEAGAAGIQLSTVRRADQITELRAATRYAPEGDRSLSLSHPLARFGAVGLDEYVAKAQPPLIVAQLETMTTDNPLDEILAAKPDVLFVGATDIAVDARLNPTVARERTDEILAAAAAHSLTAGGFGEDKRFRYAVISSDVTLLQQAVAVA